MQSCPGDAASDAFTNRAHIVVGHGAGGFPESSEPGRDCTSPSRALGRRSFVGLGLRLLVLSDVVLTELYCQLADRLPFAVAFRFDEAEELIRDVDRRLHGSSKP